MVSKDKFKDIITQECYNIENIKKNIKKDEILNNYGINDKLNKLDLLLQIARQILDEIKKIPNDIDTISVSQKIFNVPEKMIYVQKKIQDINNKNCITKNKYFSDYDKIIA